MAEKNVAIASREEDPLVALATRKTSAKRQLQKWCGLHEWEDARIFGFVGRWCYQKGVDLIADLAPWIMEAYPRSQLVCFGPPGAQFNTD